MRLTLCLAALALLAACEPEDPCGADYVYDEATHTCLRAAPDAATLVEDAGIAPPDAAVDAGAAPDAGGCEAPGFGSPCTVAGEGAPECTCEADFCALQPGATEGYCTRTGCLADTTICAAGYTCMDLSLIVPEVGSICVPE